MGNLDHILFQGYSPSDLKGHVSSAATKHPKAIELDEPIPHFIARSFELSKIPSEEYRSSVSQRRLSRALRKIRASNLLEASTLVERDIRARQVVINEILLGVTSFFRDSDVFEALLRHLKQVPSDSKLKVWSVGCSTGEELYSVAMLLAEVGLLSESFLMGTDVRNDALQIAAQGQYDMASVKSVPSEFIEKYLLPVDGRLELSATIKQKTNFFEYSAFQHPPATGWDLVLCRNLLIYLRTSSHETILHNLVESLNPGGLLVLGKAESPAHTLGLRALSRCIYVKEN